jgi:hypothetical protein
MTLDDMTIDEKRIAEQARRDAIQACVLPRLNAVRRQRGGVVTGGVV